MWISWVWDNWRRPPPRSLLLELTPKIWRMGCPDFSKDRRVRQIKSMSKHKHLVQGILPTQSVTAHEELKIQRKILQLQATKQPQHTSQKKETIIHTVQHGQLHNGNQVFELSRHLLYYFINLYYACINYTKPSITPFER